MLLYLWGGRMQYILSVSEINRYIKEIISKDLILSNLWVKGEISNYKYHYSGHMYFTLKDDKSLLKCVMFKTHASGLRFELENGMKVIIKGYVSVFERDGQYQLYVEEMQPDGIGSLHIAFEQLKRKLSEEGLFAQERKKKLPALPRSIGVVTSSTGAVVRDILHILNRRFQNVEVKIFPVQVQGEQAAKQIAGAVKRFNQLDNVEVIIVARGGGSLEELWAFNEEIVARSIFESRIPVISAVGHETDYTISDFVADVRAPTPSAAAELVVPEKRVLTDRIANLNTRLKNALYKKVSLSRLKYERLKDSISFKQPYNRVYQERMKLDILNKYMHKALQIKKDDAKAKMGALIGKLDILSPLSSLSRGYSIAKSKESGKVVKSVRDVENGEVLELNVRDGIIDCVVRDVKEGKIS